LFKNGFERFGPAHILSGRRLGAMIAPGASMSESRHSHRVNHAFAEHPPFEGTARVFDDLTDK